MSALNAGPQNDDIVLVFRPPENPAAQMAGVTPFKSLRLRLDELLDWFKGLNVDSIDLWIEGAFKSGNRTELFLSVEGRTGAKLTLRPYLKHSQAPSPPIIESPSTIDSSNQTAKTPETQNPKISPERISPSVSAVFSPGGGIERQVVALIASALGSIEMAAFELTNIYVEKALMEAIKRGVKITLVLDKSQTLGEQARLHDTLERAGADVRLFSPRRGRMRDNYIIVDGKTVEWGSYVYTERAENWNFENATFASDSLLAQQYHTDFQSLFSQAKPESRGVWRSIARFFRVF